MMDDHYESDRLRRGKEFVYEQWRKLLCIFIVGDDINTNRFTPKEVSSEQIRAVFDNGYKLAMFQMKCTLKAHSYECQDSRKEAMIERLIQQIEDRLETQKCLVTYSRDSDASLYTDAVKRDLEFSRYANEDLTKWGEKQM